MLGYISETVNVSEAALRLVFSILLGIPTAFLHRYTLYGKNPTYQHLFFAIVGVLVCYWNYGFTTIHSATTLCFTYLVLKFRGGSSLSVLITFVFNMSYLLYGYYTTSTGDYDIKWTMPQCVLTLRLIGLAFNLLDGKTPDGKLSVSQRQLALKQMPTFLEIVAFSYFPGAFLVGPQFSMKRYLDYVNGRLLDDNLKKRSKQLPDCIASGITRILIGFLYMSLYQVGSLYFSDEYMLSSEFQNQMFLKRLLFLGFWGHINLYKYICCWLFSEGVCTLFGLTYNGYDEKGRSLWNGCENVKLLTFEMANQFNHYILAFNINTNHWCAEYIYKRVKFLGSKLYSQFVTLLFLALWHGFHSGYYMTFALEFIIMYAERDVTQILERQEKLQSLLKTHAELRILSWIVTKMYTYVFMGYSVTCFVLLKWSRYHPVLSSVYYCGHIIYLSYPFISIILKKLLIKKRPAKID